MSANHDTKNVSGSKLCHHDRGIWAKCANIQLLWRHVANMSATFSAKVTNPTPEKIIRHLPVTNTSVERIIRHLSNTRQENEKDFSSSTIANSPRPASSSRVAPAGAHTQPQESLSRLGSASLLFLETQYYLGRNLSNFDKLVILNFDYPFGSHSVVCSTVVQTSHNGGCYMAQ